MAYEESIKEMARYIRNNLQPIEELSSINFELSINGRPHDGELRIQFKLGSTYEPGGVVKAGNLDAVISEYQRRFGWDKRHKPLELSFNGETAQEFPPRLAVDNTDDIPF